jgi:RNA-binding protein NOB1
LISKKQKVGEQHLPPTTIYKFVVLIYAVRMATEKLFHTIVLDAGPIIRGEPGISTLLQQCEQIISTPAVISEIRDEATRLRISTSLLPFLAQRNPKPDSVKTVTDFARKTGDLAILSRVDIQLLALSYELECERNGGDWRLRKTPGQKRTNGPPPPKPEISNEETVIGKTDEQSVPAEVSKLENSENLSANEELLEVNPNEESAHNSLPPSSRDIEKQGAPESIPSVPLPNPIISLPSKSPNGDIPPEIPEAAPEEGASGELQKEVITEEHQSQAEQIEAMTEHLEKAQLAGPSEEDGSSEGSDSEGWITPSNLKKQQDKDAVSGTASRPEPKSMQVVGLS